MSLFHFHECFQNLVSVEQKGDPLGWKKIHLDENWLYKSLEIRKYLNDKQKSKNSQKYSLHCQHMVHLALILSPILSLELRSINKTCASQINSSAYLENPKVAKKQDHVFKKGPVLLTTIRTEIAAVSIKCEDDECLTCQTTQNPFWKSIYFFVGMSGRFFWLLAKLPLSFLPIPVFLVQDRFHIF